MQSRADSPEALAKLREMEKDPVEAGYTFDPIIRPDGQIRQRQGQPFQQHNEPRTCHATTGTINQHTTSTPKPIARLVDQSSGLTYWCQSSNCLSSSSKSWRSSFEWQEGHPSWIEFIFQVLEGFRLPEIAIRTQVTGGVNSTPHRTRNSFSRVAQDGAPGSNVVGARSVPLRCTVPSSSTHSMSPCTISRRQPNTT